MSGITHSNWTGDDATYVGRHLRLRTARGKASQFPCVTCDSPAYDWSQIHGTDGLDIYADYRPMCRSCHGKYDYDPQHFWGPVCLGEAHGQHKLTEANVHEIRILLAQGITQIRIASKFKVHQTVISQIKLGKIWGWLDSKEVVANGTY